MPAARAEEGAASAVPPLLPHSAWTGPLRAGLGWGCQSQAQGSALSSSLPVPSVQGLLSRRGGGLPYGF